MRARMSAGVPQELRLRLLRIGERDRTGSCTAPAGLRPLGKLSNVVAEPRAATVAPPLPADIGAFELVLNVRHDLRNAGDFAAVFCCWRAATRWFSTHRATWRVQQRDLLVRSTWLMLLIIVPVMALTVLFAWRYRRIEQGTPKYEPDWHHSTRLELVIWAAPLLIIICLGALTWLGTHLLDPYRPLDRIAHGQPVHVGNASRSKCRWSRSTGSGCSSIRSTASPRSMSWRFRWIVRCRCTSRPRR